MSDEELAREIADLADKERHNLGMRGRVEAFALAALASARDAALEEAARVAEPPLAHRKGRVGLWRQRRTEIASAILALRDQSGESP